jgi:phospholipid/cholesterol/gamma-HCH transport system substrate-binding protein
MQRNVLETVMGAVVLLAAAAFLFIVYSASGVKEASNGYHLIMRVDRGGWITPGTDVRAAGVKVGSVVKQEFDDKEFQAVLTLDIDPRVKLTTDSSAIVDQEGLLGGNFVSLEPGSDDTYLKDGETFRHSQGAISLGSLIAKVVTGGDSKSEEKTQ